MSIWQNVEHASGFPAEFRWVILSFLVATLAVMMLRKGERARIRSALILFAFSMFGLLFTGALLSYRHAAHAVGLSQYSRGLAVHAHLRGRDRGQRFHLHDHAAFRAAGAAGHRPGLDPGAGLCGHCHCAAFEQRPGSARDRGHLGRHHRGHWFLTAGRAGEYHRGDDFADGAARPGRRLDSRG